MGLRIHLCQPDAILLFLIGMELFWEYGVIGNGGIKEAGACLVRHYKTVQKVRRLVSLGILSNLGDTVPSCKLSERSKEKAKLSKNLDDLKKTALHYGAEFLYLFQDSCWSVFVADMVSWFGEPNLGSFGRRRNQKVRLSK